MRAGLGGALSAVGLAALLGGCRGEDEAALVWTALDAGEVEVFEDRAHGLTRYRVELPPAERARASGRLSITFQERLDGAKVDAEGVGPRHRLTLLREHRVAGAALAIPLPAARLDRVELLVHHHLRPPPLVASVRLGRPRPAEALQ
jgi:hypothetical protein